jgi:hypothetical protein
VKCGKPQCQKKHGPYLYAYWKEGNKTKSGYVGKKLEDLDLRKIAKDQDLRPSVLRRMYALSPSRLISFSFKNKILPTAKHNESIPG